MAARLVQQGSRHVKPIMSVNRDEARRRVRNLYKAWYRQMPYISKEYTFQAMTIKIFEFESGRSPIDLASER